MSEENAAQTLLRFLAAIEERRDVDGHPYALTPTGYKLVDLEHLLPHPRRIKEAVTLLDQPSFIHYVERFKKPTSLLLAEPADLTFTFFPRYHAQNEDAEDPAWLDHRAVLQLRHSEEWLAWKNKDRVSMQQVEFARFIEEHLDEIRTPSGAELLEMCLNFEQHSEVVFSSAARLQDGSFALTYDDTGRRGQMRLPKTLDVSLPIFWNAAASRVQARLRYRIHSQKLMLWYELVRPQQIVETALQSVSLSLQQRLQMPVVLGAVDDDHGG